MRVWIDLANSPHVPFFRALLPELERRGAEVEFTARDFAQTLELAEAGGLKATIVGGHGGRKLWAKAGNLAGRVTALRAWAGGKRFDLAVSHNSYAHVAAARLLCIPSVTLMDYEHQPANHLAFRLASRVVVPRSFPAEALRKYGARPAKVRRYNGTKEDVYLSDFEPDESFQETLRALGVEPENVLVTVRPPARDALYHRFENELFDELVERLCAETNARIVMLARSPEQREQYASRRSANLILPREALDGSNLIAASDLVISAGGTMNREAAALGVPAATIYAGRWAAVDEELVREGRLRRICTGADVQALPLEKKRRAEARRALHVRAEVADLIMKSL